LQDAANELDYLDKMKGPQLKELCKQFGLKVSGKKADLQTRLREHLLAQANDAGEVFDPELESMTFDDLTNALVSRGLNPVGTTREELLRQYAGDLAFVDEVRTEVVSSDQGSNAEAISRALEKAAKEGGSVSFVMQEVKEKAGQLSRFIDVRIPSLGLKPHKATAGGAPSVTADVLRKLAGDPFSDPPKYGTVRQ
jgi:hypothetical protein